MTRSLPSATGRAIPSGRGVEVWRPAPAFEGSYDISNRGRVRSLHFQPRRACKLGTNSDGYSTVALSKLGRRTTKTVHRLVAIAFRSGRSPLHNEVGHLDGDRRNASAANLQWVSRRENLAHRKLHGTDDRGERSVCAKLTNQQAAEIRAQKGHVGYRDLAERYGVSLRTIHDVVYGRRYVLSAGAPIAIAVASALYFGAQLLRAVFA